MWHSLRMSPEVSADFRATTAELLQSTSRALVLAAGSVYLLCFLATAAWPQQIGSNVLLIAPIIVPTLLLTYHLLPRRFWAAQIIWQVGLMATIALATWLFGRIEIAILPVGSVEQHGPHLPLKTDWHLSSRIAEEAARRCPDLLLVMPPVPYGIVPHVMDFPGSITIGWRTFVNYCYDILHGLAYHGFKKIIVLNGHGSNKHLLDQVTRRVLLETDAVCALANWWDLLRVAPDFESRWRNEILPGGGGHAGELETSVYLYLEPQSVRGKKIADPQGSGTKSPYTSADVFGFGSSPVTIPGFHPYGEGVSGLPSTATAEKGELIFEEAVSRLIEFAQEFALRPRPQRRDFHEVPPTIPPPL